MDQNQNDKKNDKSEKKMTKDMLDVFKNRDLVIFSNYLYYLSYFLYFIAIILLTVTYWKTHLGENAKFQTYVQLLMAATIIMTVYSVYLQQVTYRETSTYNQLNNFDNNFKELLDDTLKFFIDNPDMNYYYEELFYNKSDYKEEDRNKNLETQYTFIILSRVSNIIYSFYVYGNKFSEKNDRIEQSEITLKNILDSFFASKIFNNNWKSYKGGLATEITKQYIKENFNK
jgi:amino acid transporter